MKKNEVMGRLHQQGMTTLTISLIVLFLMSLIILFTSSNALFELKIGNNQYYQAKAQESARGGIAYATAWLVNGSNMSSIAWNADVTGPSGNNQRATAATFPTAVSTQSIGGNTVTVSLWRDSTAPTILELMAAVSGDGNSTVRQKIIFNTVSTPNTLNLGNAAPVVVNGGITKASDSVIINMGDTGVAISTSTLVTNASAIDSGSIECVDSNDVSYDCSSHISYGAFNAGTDAAWSYLFPNTTKAQMKAAADAQTDQNTKTIYYYTNTNPPPDPWHLNLGTASKPVIVVFDVSSLYCPKINAKAVIYGLVYYASDCSQQKGLGSMTINGSLVVDTSINKLTGSPDFVSWSVFNQSGTIDLPPTITKTLSKHAASWRDF